MIIVWCVFLLQAIILILIGLNRGFGKSLVSFLVNVFNCVIAFLVARIAVNSLAEKVGKRIIVEIGKKYSSSLTGLTVVETFSTFITSILIGIVEFFIIYIIMFIINSIIKHLVIYQKAEKISFNYKLATVLVSLLSAGVTFFVFITPIGVVYNSVMPGLISAKVQKIPFVSSSFFDQLTQMPHNEKQIQPSQEIQYTVNTVMAASNIINDRKTEIDNVQEFRNNFANSYFLPTVIGETGSSAAKQWQKGEDFLGEKIEIPQGREGELVVNFLKILENWDKDVVIDDVNTILDVHRIFKDYGMEKIEKDDGFLEALAEETFSEELLLTLYRNNDFMSMVPAVLDYGLAKVSDYIEIDLKEKYQLDTDISKMTEEDVRREARTFSGIIRSVLDMREMDELSELDTKEIEKKIEEMIKEIAEVQP